MTTHQICEAARNSDCPCGAPPGCPCVCQCGCYHKARIYLAAEQGRITWADCASVTYGETFNGMDTITDPGLVTA